MRLVDDPPVAERRPRDEPVTRMSGLTGGVVVLFHDGSERRYTSATEYAITGALLLIEDDRDTLAVVDWRDVRAVESGGAGR